LGKNKLFFLGQFCYPLVSLIATLFPKLLKVSTTGIVILTIAGTLAFCYILLTGFFCQMIHFSKTYSLILTAFRSPCSPFVDYRIGKYIVVSFSLNSKKEQTRIFNDFFRELCGYFFI